MKFETIQFEVNGTTGILTINRPAALNAINSKVLEEIQSCLTNQVEKDKKIKCLILTGQGEKAFVAGADIREMSSLTPQEAQRFAERGQKVLRRFEVLEIPVIAAVNGYALGGGLELALSCDFIYASNNAKFGLPEVSLGLIPGFGGTQRLARHVGWAMAKELIYSGRTVSAEEGLKMGLVNRLLEKTQLMETALATAKEIATRGPIAVSKAKQAVNRGYDLPLDEGLHLERELFGELFASRDQKEGTQAFLEKRSPQFLGE